MKSLFKIIIPCYGLQVQVFHERFMHQNKLDHNCHYTICSINNTTSFQFQWNNVKIMELLINNPNLYTHLCYHTILKLVNYFGVTQHTGITFKVRSSFKEAKPHMHYFRVILNASIAYKVGLFESDLACGYFI